MHMRMVEVKVKEGLTSQLRTHYANRVITGLSEARGCRYAGLLQEVRHQHECISLTLWDSEEDCLAYERSGLFGKLLDETRPYLLESTESRIQLSQDLTLEYVPVPQEPVVTVMPIEATSNEAESRESVGSPVWVRIISLKVKPGKLDEFKQFYVNHVLHRLRAVKGCRYVYLTGKAQRPDEILSVTSWDTKEDAEKYEQSGAFGVLLRSAQHVLSDLYQWKKDEEKEGTVRSTTSEDPVVEQYTVLVSKSFK